MLTFRRTSTTHIRWMIRRDLPVVLWIQDCSYVETWSTSQWLLALRDRRCIGVVAEQRDEILGYCLYRVHPHYIEPLNMAVHPKRRREGIGTQMIENLDHKLTSNRTRIATLVDEYNVGGQLFLRHCGFRWVETIRGLDSDAYLMEYRQ